MTTRLGRYCCCCYCLHRLVDIYFDIAASLSYSARRKLCLMQGLGYEVSEQNAQSSLPRPFQQASQQRPYFQAAGVDKAQPAGDARPIPQQQVPLQQIPLFSQPKARSQPGPKPALFVPSQPGSRPLSATSLRAPTQPVSAPAFSQAVPPGRQNPAVSSRLSALKARLDTDKQKAGSEPNKTARCFLLIHRLHPVPFGAPRSLQSANGWQAC